MSRKPSDLPDVTRPNWKIGNWRTRPLSKTNLLAASLVTIGMLALLLIGNNRASAHWLAQTETSDPQAELNSNQLFLPLIRDDDLSDPAQPNVEEGQLVAANVEQQASVLYSKYLYSRWSSPNGHYGVQLNGCGLLIICSLRNAQNVATMNLNDYASASVTGISLFSSITKVAWADLEQVAVAGDYAGWQVSNLNLTNLALFKSSYLRTYLNGRLQEQSPISSLTDLGLIDELDGGQSISFRTSKNFNRVEIVFDSNTLGLSLFNSIQFYYAFAAKLNDLDQDGVSDLLDSDLDGDGIPNSVELCTQPGSVNYEFYNSSPSGWTVNNIPTSGAQSMGIVGDFDASDLQRQFTPFDAATYSVRYTALLNVPYEGNFTFYLRAEGGSRLWIDEALVVDNDGWHGEQERSGTIHLAPGYHTLQLLYFKYLTGNSLTVSVSETSLPKQMLPFSVLISCNPQTDSDGDGLTNDLDWDSDNDSIPDALEALKP